MQSWNLFHILFAEFWQFNQKKKKEEKIKEQLMQTKEIFIKIEFLENINPKTEYRRFWHIELLFLLLFVFLLFRVLVAVTVCHITSMTVFYR